MTHAIRDDTTIGGSLVVTGTAAASNLSGTNTGDQTNIAGNSATATKWATARTLALTGQVTGTSGAFDGSGNATLAVTVGTLNQSTTGSAATLTTARTINGVSFNGSANISVNATSGTPADLASTAALGSSALAAKADHVHKAPGATYGSAARGTLFTLASGTGIQSVLALTLPVKGIYQVIATFDGEIYAGYGALFAYVYNDTLGTLLKAACISGTGADDVITRPVPVTIFTTAVNQVVSLRVSRVVNGGSVFAYQPGYAPSSGTAIEYVLLSATP